MNAVFRVLTPGGCTTIQDLGRPGQAHLGVPVSGAMDDYSHRIANWLCGNTASCATLEMTMAGAHLEALAPCTIALTGASMDFRINGKPALQWQSHQVQAHEQISLGMAANGCRSYLAITGGFASRPVLASRSTYLGGRLGGYEGRMLREGDILASDVNEHEKSPVKRWLPWSPVYADTITLRVIAGPQDDWFCQQDALLYGSAFTVSSQSNRMGCRLLGPVIKKNIDAPENLLSIPVTAGNIQLPPNGQPIVLFREQTIGGYPIIATVLSCDLWRLAQAPPGAKVRFARLSLEEGQDTARQWQEFLATAHALLQRQGRRP